MNENEISLETIQRTGSISQDALRLGFQPTCHKGIAKLLKVDNKTIEACDAFLERHKESEVEWLKDIASKQQANLLENWKASQKKYIDKNEWFYDWKVFFAERKTKNQKDRVFDVTVKSISAPELDIITGIWKTSILLQVCAHAWAGWYSGVFMKFKEQTYTITETCSTRAVVCKVNYVPYDEYHAMFIPDDAVKAAFDAHRAGLHNLTIVFPKLQKASEPDLDPIIVGFIGTGDRKQMWIIAWFGYEKDNHMSCNA